MVRVVAFRSRRGDASFRKRLSLKKKRFVFYL